MEPLVRVEGIFCNRQTIIFECLELEEGILRCVEDALRRIDLRNAEYLKLILQFSRRIGNSQLVSLQRMDPRIYAKPVGQNNYRVFGVGEMKAAQQLHMILQRIVNPDGLVSVRVSEHLLAHCMPGRSEVLRFGCMDVDPSSVVHTRPEDGSLIEGVYRCPSNIHELMLVYDLAPQLVNEPSEPMPKRLAETQPKPLHDEDWLGTEDIENSDEPIRDRAYLANPFDYDDTIYDDWLNEGNAPPPRPIRYPLSFLRKADFNGLADNQSPMPLGIVEKAGSGEKAGVIVLPRLGEVHYYCQNVGRESFECYLCCEGQIYAFGEGITISDSIARAIGDAIARWREENLDAIRLRILSECGKYWYMKQHERESPDRD